MQQAQVAREISYASSAATIGGRALIRAVENATGRMRLIRRARGYEDEIARGRDFWTVMGERYGVTLDITGGSLSNIPATGPLILIANHPYGILDGLMMGQILSQRRADFRILAHRVFGKSSDLSRVILPISFDGTKEATRTNIETRKAALNYLTGGGAIGIFPGGTVSTSSRPFGRPMDPGWRSFTAKLVAKSGARVVPVYFEGQNSRLFQIASHVHLTLRLALLINEFRARVDAPVRLAIGRPIDPGQLAAHGRDPKQMMDFLRKATYELASKPLPSLAYGFEFEQRYKA